MLAMCIEFELMWFEWSIFNLQPDPNCESAAMKSNSPPPLPTVIQHRQDMHQLQQQQQHQNHQHPISAHLISSTNKVANDLSPTTIGVLLETNNSIAASSSISK